MSTAERIKRYMQSSDISESSLAQTIGLREQTLHEILTNERVLSADVYLSICNALGLSVNFFYS